MSTKKKTHTDDAADEVSDKTVIRVRRGALRRFDLLKQKSADLPVEITWDRRTADRRAQGAGADAAPGAERRGADRRQRPPFTWDMADFVVVGDRSREDGAPAAPEPEEHPRAATLPRRARRREDTR